MNELHDLELILRSRTPLLVIESLEEPRIVQLFTQLALRIGQPAWQWTVTDGLRRLETGLATVAQSEQPAHVLRHIKGLSRGGIFLLLDYHPYLAEPIHVRLIKEIAQDYAAIPRTLALISHALNTPPELRHLTARFELRLPDRPALLAMINQEAQAWEQCNGRRVRANREAVTRLADNLSGVTASDARGMPSAPAQSGPQRLRPGTAGTGQRGLHRGRYRAGCGLRPVCRPGSGPDSLGRAPVAGTGTYPTPVRGHGRTDRSTA